MFGEKTSFPKDGEIVLCTVTKIYHHSVFVQLDEYKRSGMLHISEVSPGRIRNLRDYVSEGKKIVCKVLSINKEKGHIDVSLRRVTDSQRREKANLLKMEQIGKRILENAAAKLKTKAEDLYKKVSPKILEEYEVFVDCFEDVAANSIDLSTYMDKKSAEVLTEMIQSRIKPPEVSISGILTLSTYHPEGVDVIRKVLEPAVKKEMNPTYVGSGKYRITVKASDYKSAEKELKEGVDEVLKLIESQKGEGSFERLEA